MKAFILIGVVLVLGLSASGAAAQANPSAATAQPGADPAITANGAIGEVKVIDAGGKQLILKTDAGSLVTIVLNDVTAYMRVAPGETTLSKATKIAFTDVGEGDRVFARGTVSDDRKTVPARVVIVMNKVDIAKKQELEREEWKKRGILGVITAVKPETKEITISSRAGGTQQSIVIPVSDKVELRRYAPDSIKFADAKTAKLEELKVGDQLRALGDRNPEGTQFAAEKVVTGTFRIAAGVVTAIDATTGEIKINDMQTKVPLTVIVRPDSVLRKFPPADQMGAMTMARPGQGPAGAQPSPQPAQTLRPGNDPRNQAPTVGTGGAPGGPTGRMGGGGMNIQEMIERQPTISINDVKVGDTIIVSSTQGADPSRLTAISLISGADTLLNLIAARQQQQPGPRAAPNPSAGLGGVQFGIGLP